MAFIKKKWVDVPDPSNPPAIPEGQGALARFDAANMNRIEEGIDSKAPNGHGLGTTCVADVNTTYKDFMHKGCGFYAPSDLEESPHGTEKWTELIQLARSVVEGKETGSQLAILDFDPNNPRMWFRTLLLGTVGKWVEMLHTGNAVSELSKLGMPKFASGSYVGTGTYGTANPISITVPFKPKLMMIGANAVNTGILSGAMDIFNEGWFTSEYVSPPGQDVYMKYKNGVISMYAHGSTNGATNQYNVSGATYDWYIFG